MRHKHLFFLIAILAFVGMAWAQVNVAALGGTTDYLGVIDSDYLSIGTSDFSYSAWFKTTSSIAGIAGKSASGGTTSRFSVQFAYNAPNQLYVRFQPNDTTNYTVTVPTLLNGGSTWNDGTWHNVYVTVDRDAVMSVYMDGQFAISTDISATSAVDVDMNGYFWIGAYGDNDGTGINSNFSYSGSISEVTVWDVARSAGDIATDYNTFINPSNANLVGYWKLNDDFSDGYATDYSASGMDATVFGTVQSIPDNDITLPIELSSFTAVPNAQYFVELHWTTQSETNVAGFRVYRSENLSLKDAVMFNTFIPATNTSVTQHYTFVDQEIYADGTYYYWLENVDMNGTSQFHGPVIATVIHGEPGAPAIVPTVSGIEKVYPNPFNPSTSINYMLDKDAAVSIKVYNVRGQMMSSLFEGSKEAGFHSVVWNGTTDSGIELPSGIYTVTVQIGSDIHSRRVVLSK